MDSRPVVLIADDEPAAARLVARSLDEEGFRTAVAHGGRDAIDRVWDLNPDVLLVDMVMPRMSGLDVIDELRDTHPVPIILISGRDTVANVREGLDRGAADYITKPFSPVEVAARIRSVLRRHRRLAKGVVTIGNAQVDLDANVLRMEDEVVDLSRKEWRLLERLIAAGGGVVTHDELLTTAFGPAFVGDAAHLRLWIGQLRRRLGVPAWEEGPIRTVPGIGYALDPGGEIPPAPSRRPRRAPAARRPSTTGAG